jgi:hypothetical protein
MRIKITIALILLVSTYVLPKTQVLNYTYDPMAFSDTIIKKYTKILPCYPSFHNEQYILGFMQLSADAFGIYVTACGIGYASGASWVTYDKAIAAGVAIGPAIIVLNRFLSLPVNKYHNKTLKSDTFLPLLKSSFPTKHTFGISSFVIMQGSNGISIGIHYVLSKHRFRLSYSVLNDSGYYASFDRKAFVAPQSYQEDLIVYDKNTFTFNYEYPIVKTEYRDLFFGVGVRYSSRQYHRSVSYLINEGIEYTKKENDFTSYWQLYPRAGLNWQLLNNAFLYFSVSIASLEWNSYLNDNNSNLKINDVFPAIGGEYGVSVWF